MRKLGLSFVAVATAVTLYVVAPASGSPGGPNRITLTCAAFIYNQGMRRQVDPILQPGVEVSAHMHDFYGRTFPSDFTFAEPAWPLVGGHENDPGYLPLPTSCQNYGDWASYWYPTPEFNGTFIDSGRLQETWRTPGVWGVSGSGGEGVHAPPFGMTYIVGNSHATSQAEEGAHTRFTCGSLDGPGFASPQDCTGIGTVTAELTFPDCFDGQAQIGHDIVNNRQTGNDPAGIPFRHFTYSDPATGQCPSGFYMMAQLITRQHFIDPRTGTTMVKPFNADNTLALSFSSGPYYTYHGDYLDAWNIGLEIDIVACLNHTRSFSFCDGLNNS